MNTEILKPKKYDLEDRTLRFATNVRSYIKLLPRTVGNNEDIKQLVRSSGSVGANYREANDSLGKKDFAMRIRICRKEAKESKYWLELLEMGPRTTSQRDLLAQEALELMKIFGAILQKVVS